MARQAHSGMTFCGSFGDDICLDTGLRRYDGQGVDTGLHRHDKQWSQTGMGLAGIQYILIFPVEAGNQYRSSFRRGPSRNPAPPRLPGGSREPGINK